MAIPRFDVVFSQTIVDTEAAANLLRYLRDTQGDLQADIVLRHIPEALWRAKMATVAALTECGKAASAASDALARYPGAPKSLADLQGKAVAVEAAAVQWNKDFGAWLAGLNVSQIVELKAVDRGGIGPVGMVVFAEAFDGATIDPLRKSEGLAGLIAAFEAAGA